MIRYLVDFALRNRMLVLALGVALLIWGIISFHNLPVEAYPDVADKYVWVITQWPGRAAEEVEQQVTIPIETQMNGVGHLTHLRSTSLAGLSFITVLFDDESDNLQNRQQVLEKLTLVNLPPGLNPQIGPDFSPAGQIYFYTLQSTNPQVRHHGLEGAAGLGGFQAPDVGAECGCGFDLWRRDARIPGAGRSRQAGGLRACAWRRWSRHWRPTTSTVAAASSRRASRLTTSAPSA